MNRRAAEVDRVAGNPVHPRGDQRCGLLQRSWPPLPPRGHHHREPAAGEHQASRSGRAGSARGRTRWASMATTTPASVSAGSGMLSTATLSLSRAVIVSVAQRPGPPAQSRHAPNRPLPRISDKAGARRASAPNGPRGRMQAADRPWRQEQTKGSAPGCRQRDSGAVGRQVRACGRVGGRGRTCPPVPVPVPVETNPVSPAASRPCLHVMRSTREALRSNDSNGAEGPARRVPHPRAPPARAVPPAAAR